MNRHITLNKEKQRSTRGQSELVIPLPGIWSVTGRGGIRWGQLLSLRLQEVRHEQQSSAT